MPAQIFGVVVAGEDERLHDPLAVDLLRDLVRVLLDDREQVREQVALERGQLPGRVRRRDVMRRAVDRPVRGDRHGTLGRAVAAGGGGAAGLVGVGLGRAARHRRGALAFGGGQAAVRIGALLRNERPSSRRRW
jgi:hypothetical protein